MVHGTSDWLRSVWSWPGVRAAPNAAQRPPRQSSNAINAYGTFELARISSVMAPRTAYSATAPYTTNSKLTICIANNALDAP